MEVLEKLMELSVITHNLSESEVWDFVREAFYRHEELVYPRGDRLYLLRREARDWLVNFISRLHRGLYLGRGEIRRATNAIWEQIGGELPDIKMLLEQLIEQELVWTADGRLTANFVYSNLTDNYYWRHDPDLVWVVCAGEEEEPCLLDEARRLAFWCNRTECWYHNISYDCVVVEGETYLFSAVEHDVFRWSDGSYHWEPEIDLGLCGYHSGYRPRYRGGQCLSFELEVEVGLVDPEFGDAVREVWDEAEEDSSLGLCGAELIIGFVPLNQISEKLHEIVEVLEKFDCRVPDDYYGFHISASIDGWELDDDQLVKLARTFYGQQELVYRVARRESNRYCKWVSQPCGCPETKYRALRRDGDRLEFRIFKASTNYFDLRLCALLVEAFLKFSLSEADNFSKFLEEYFPELLR